MLLVVIVGLSLTSCDKDDDEVSNIHNGHEFVDLGLPSGLKWATCNVGADSAYECGFFLAWGETDPKDYYDYSTYKFGDWNSLTKYCSSEEDGIVDDKTVLEPEDDAATVNWGGSWRMPTNDELRELSANSLWGWVDDYRGSHVGGVVAYRLKSESDKLEKISKFGQDYVDLVFGQYSVEKDVHIFLPMVGYCRGSIGGDPDGEYWSSSRDVYSSCARIMSIDQKGIHVSAGMSREFGAHVRPVCP